MKIHVKVQRRKGRWVCLTTGASSNQLDILHTFIKEETGATELHLHLQPTKEEK